MSGKLGWFSHLFSRKSQADALPVPNPAWEPGQTLLDDFIVERLLGEGGMGKVFLVRSRSSGQHFAVKRTHSLSAESQRDFLSELQTWIDLPEHPNLAPCCFFRTIRQEIVIFAEYVAGGSLADWIRDRQLTGAAQILDVAIQFAWGLHAAHERGLVHQDVKPANVLMTTDGITKVADFGLARARARSGSTTAAGGNSILVSAGGMTPAYCSPEQAEGKPLTRKTDIWSWGVSVLEMFTGGVTWRSGVAAPEVLEGYLTNGSPDRQLPAMPAALGEVLQKCLRHDPARRWPSMTTLAVALKNVYRSSMGNDYPRPVPSETIRKASGAVAQDRQLGGSNWWGDPRALLIKALEAEGRDPAEVETLLSPRAGSRKAQAVADLTAFAEARRIFERLVAAGHKEVESSLAAVWSNIAVLHLFLNDKPGAVAAHDKQIAAYQRLVTQEGRGRAPDLARAYHSKASTLKAFRELREALPVHDEGISLWEQLVYQDARRDLTNELASAFVNKANTLSELGELKGALKLYDQAVALLEMLVDGEGRADLNADLANVFTNKGAALTQSNESRSAVRSYDSAIAILEKLIQQEWRSNLAHRLATTYSNKACTLNDLGETHAALALHDQAIGLRRRLVYQEGRHEVSNTLAVSYKNKGAALHSLGDFSGAVAMYDQAMAIEKQLVELEGRSELAHELAMSHMNKGLALHSLDAPEAAVPSYDQAIAIYERLIDQEWHPVFASDLAKTCLQKGRALDKRNDIQAALLMYNQAIALNERLVYREGARESAGDLAQTYGCKGNAFVALRDNQAAGALYDKALAIYEGLAHEEGRREFLGDVAWVRANRAVVLLALGDRRRAQTEGRQAVADLQTEFARTGRTDLQQTLNWARKKLQEVL